MTGPTYDMAFLDHYTKDTIVTPTGTRIADGGAFFYGASVAVRIGLITAAITRDVAPLHGTFPRPYCRWIWSKSKYYA